MAMDQFIKIGSLKGEAKDKAHKDEIDVLSWNWGLTSNGSFHSGGGGGAGKASVQDLTFTHYIDKASPELILACMNGKHLEWATLLVRKSGEKPLDYFMIDMEPVIVTGVSTGGSHGEDRPIETVTLHFGKVEIYYVEQTPTGKGGAKIQMNWNIAENYSE